MVSGGLFHLDASPCSGILLSAEGTQQQHNMSHTINIIEDLELRVAGVGIAPAGDALGRGRRTLGAFHMPAEAARARDIHGPPDDKDTLQLHGRTTTGVRNEGGAGALRERVETAEGVVVAGVARIPRFAATAATAAYIENALEGVIIECGCAIRACIAGAFTGGILELDACAFPDPDGISWTDALLAFGTFPGGGMACAPGGSPPSCGATGAFALGPAPGSGNTRTTPTSWAPPAAPDASAGRAATTRTARWHA